MKMETNNSELPALSTPLPDGYLVFGPSGVGKTRAVIEILAQHNKLVMHGRDSDLSAASQQIFLKVPCKPIDLILAVITS